MRFRICGVSFVCLLTLAASLALAGCNNTLNPLCSSARPAPQIGSLTPSTVTMAQLQSGEMLTIDGSNFVSSTMVLINSTALAANVVSGNQLNLKLTTDVIAKPGQVTVKVQTPEGNTGNLGCTSGGTSSALTLTVNQ